MSLFRKNKENKIYFNIIKEGERNEWKLLNETIGEEIKEINKKSKICPNCKKRDIEKKTKWAYGYTGIFYESHNKCKKCGAEWKVGYKV